MVHCCVALMAYNEEGNIDRLLEALCTQRLSKVAIDEIVVVASGCTDRTEEIVRQFCAKDARVKLLTQHRREGKASAINHLLRHTSSEVIVLQSADTLPNPDTIENLVAPFSDPQVGMAGGHPLPTNDPRTFMGYVSHLLWRLHHRVSLRRPKMGELIAFRNIFRQIPYDSAVDEASIEPLILGQGLELHYVPEAIVYNRGPETVTDFFKQRRRIYAIQGIHDEWAAHFPAFSARNAVRLALFSVGAGSYRPGSLCPAAWDVRLSGLEAQTIYLGCG